jgi:integrase
LASIEKRGKNSYRLIVEVGYGPDSKRIKRSKTVNIDDQALLKTTKKLQDYLNTELTKFKIEVEAGEYIAPEKMTFKAFVEEWRTKYAENKLSYSTIKTFESMLKVHILTAIGHLRLDQIKPLHLVTLLDSLRKNNKRPNGKTMILSDGSIRYAHRVLSNIFLRAVEWQVIKTNPMKGVGRPAITEKEQKYYNETEAQKVIAALYMEPSMWRLFFLTAMIGGLRRGEILALEWTDLDFEDSLIKITKNIPVKIKGKAVVKSPKTKSSIREVDMPVWYMAEMEDYLKEWKVQQDNIGDNWLGEDTQYVFHAGYGKPLGLGSANQWWKAFINKHNLKFIRVHDLRHTSATLMIDIEDEGFIADDQAMLKIIQKRLGHSRFETTANLYTHVTKKLSQKSAAKFEKLSPHLNVPNSSPMQN